MEQIWNTQNKYQCNNLNILYALKKYLYVVLFIGCILFTHTYQTRLPHGGVRQNVMRKKGVMGYHILSAPACLFGRVRRESMQERRGHVSRPLWPGDRLRNGSRLGGEQTNNTPGHKVPILKNNTNICLP